MFPLASGTWIGVGVVVLLGTLLGASRLQVAHLETKVAVVQRMSDEARAQAQKERADQEAAHRKEENRRTAANAREVDDANRKTREEHAARLVADASAGRLQRRISAILAAPASPTASDPTAAVTSSPAGDANGMLADVLGRCVTRVRLLATVADERGIAGQACERSYDSLTESPQ